jgi:hypothetical protein
MKLVIPFMMLACGWLTAADAGSEALEMFAPLPAVMESSRNPITEAKVRLGRMLYYESRLSKSQDVSCNTCHLLDRDGAENEPVSTGYKGLKGNRDAPTVYNAAGHVAQFWDGRAADVEEQAKGPMLNPVEMAMPSNAQVLAVLNSIPEYVAAFRQAFPGETDPVSFDNAVRAVGAFERKLVTPARWDSFLGGNRKALTEAEQQGSLPQWRLRGRRVLPEARTGQTLDTGRRPRPVRLDQKRSRPPQLQSPFAAQHRRDRAVFPQWLRTGAEGSGRAHGLAPVRPQTAAERRRGHPRLAPNAHGRHSGRVHCAAKPAAGHGGYAQTGPELRGGGSRHPKAGQTRHSR